MKATSISINRAENGCTINCSYEGYNDEGERMYENKNYIGEEDIFDIVLKHIGALEKTDKVFDAKKFLGEK